MTMSPNREDREYARFEQDIDGEPAVRMIRPNEGKHLTHEGTTGFVNAGEGWVWWVSVFPSGTSGKYVKFYDNTVASGAVICKVDQHSLFWPPIKFENGIYADCTGGAVYV